MENREYHNENSNEENFNKKSKSTQELEEIKEDKGQNKEEYHINVIEKKEVEEERSKDINVLNKNTNLNSGNSNHIRKENNPFLFTQEVLMALENYFTVVKLNKDLREKNLLFLDLYEKNSENKDFIFLLFWYPFITSDEMLSVEILNTTKVYMGEKVIENIFSLTISSKELNNHAFNLALENSFHDSLLLVIINQGKIKIPIEWLFEKIKQRKVNLIEECWVSNNDCCFETEKFSQNFLDFYKKTLNLKVSNSSAIIADSSKIDISKINSFTNALVNKTIKKIDSNRFDNTHTTLDRNFSMNNSNSGIINGMQKEYTDLFTKNSGKLSLSKLILLANYYVAKSTFADDKEKDSALNIIRAICIFDKEKKSSDNILQGLYITKNKEIAAELLEANLLNVSITVFQTALKFKDLRFCLLFYERYSDFKIFDKESLHDEIIEKLNDDLNNMEVYLFFIKNFSPDFRLNTTKTLVKIIEDIMQVGNQNNKIMNNFSNPIKIFVLIAEILNRIKSKFPSLDSNMQRIIQKCLDYSENIQMLIEDDSVFRELHLERDLTKRSTLDIISQNNFLILLKNKLIEKMVDDLWSGPYDIQGSFLEVSSQYRSLNVNVNSKDYDIYTKERTSFASKKVKFLKSNFTHFKVWQRNINTKYYVEILIGLILLIYGQVVSFYYINEYKNVLEFNNTQLANYSSMLINLQNEQFINGKNFIENIRNSYNSTYINNTTENVNLQNFNSNSLENYLQNMIKENSAFNFNSEIKNITQIFVEYNIDFHVIQSLLGCQSFFILFFEKINNMKMWLNYLDNLLWIYLLIPFDYIMRVIYLMKARKPNLGLTLYPDLGLIIFAIIMKISSFDSQNIIQKILANLSYDSINEFNYLPYLTLLQDFITNDPFNIQLIALSIMCTLLWLRMILQIRGTKTFGPLIVIFLVSIKGVLKYVILFLIITFGYSCCAYLVFYRIDGFYYQNPFYCFIYFFLLSLGGDPSFDSYSKLFSEKPYIPYLGGLFIVLVMILNVIVFFNLIIALLSNIFETYQNYSLQLYIQKKIDIRKKYYDDEERFNSLLVSYFPFNILTFPLGVGLLFMVDKNRTKKINKLIMYINYSFYAFFYTITFSLLTLILIPFSFMKISYSKFLQIFVDEIQQYFKAYKIMSFLFFLMFGLIYQFKSFVVDSYLFFKDLWKKKIPLVTDTENLGKYSIKKELLKIMIKMIKMNGSKNSNTSNINQQIGFGNNSFSTNIFGSSMKENIKEVINNAPSSNEINYNIDETKKLSLSLEKFLFLLSKQLDPNAEKKYKEKLNILEYCIENEDLIKKQYENEKINENNANDLGLNDNNFNFQKNQLNYSPIFKMQGFDYDDFVDYLFNFCDDKYIINLPTLINVVTTCLKTYEIRLFYANISDKNYKNYTTKKQLLFFEKIDSLMKKEQPNKLEKKMTIKAMVIEMKESENKERNISSQNFNSNIGDISETKNLYENNLNNNNLLVKNNSIKNKYSLLEEKKPELTSDVKEQFSKLLKSKEVLKKIKYDKKIQKNRNLFELPDILFIPLITRTCVDSFYNDLKEFQNDLSKKISENILKNQKYLEEIIKEKSSRVNEISKRNEKLENKAPLANLKNTLKNKSKSKYNVAKDLQNGETNGNTNFNIKDLKINKVENEVDYDKLENFDKLEIQNLDRRINNLEEKMDQLLFMTQKIFQKIDKKENTHYFNGDESHEEEYGVNQAQISYRSTSTIKIDKYDEINYDGIEQ